jgi:hypothetical protein
MFAKRHGSWGSTSLGNAIAKSLYSFLKYGNLWQEESFID